MNQVITSIVLGAGAYAGYKMYGLYHKYNTILQSMKVTKANSIELHESYALIPYSYNGGDYSVRIPYIRSKVCHMDAFIVSAKTKDGLVDITQQPGIPYLLTPEQLSCDSIYAHNVDTDEHYSYDEQPLYLADIN